MATNRRQFIFWLMTFVVGYSSKPLTNTNNQIIVVTGTYFGNDIPSVSSPTAGTVIYLRSNPVRIVLRNGDSMDVEVRFAASANLESNNDIANDSGSNITVVIARGTSPETPLLVYQTITVYKSSEIGSTPERRVNNGPQTSTVSPRPESTGFGSTDYGKRYDAPISSFDQNYPPPFDQRRELSPGQVPRRLAENPAPTPSSAIDRDRPFTRLPTPLLTSKPCIISTTPIPNPVNPINNEPAIPRRRQPVNRDAVNSEPGLSTTKRPNNNDGSYSHEREVQVQLSGRRIPWAEEKGVSERIVVGANQKREPAITDIGISEVNEGPSSRDTGQVSRLLGTWLSKPRRDFRTTTAEELEKKLREYVFLGKIIGPSSAYRTLSRDWRSTPASKL